MATDKLFTVVGISSLNGNYKVRFANDMMRIKVLDKSGHQDIRLYPLEKATTKYEAARQLLTVSEFSDAIAQATITEYLDEKAPKAKTSAVKAIAKAVKAPKVAKVVEDENVPFN